MAEAEKVAPEEMSFVDHLEALRWHLLRAVGSIFIFAIGAFLAKDFIFHDLILGPSRPDFFTYRKLCEIGASINSPGLCIDKINFTLQSREMSGQFTVHMMSSIVIGLVLAFPYAFWELWRFVKPGLYPAEQKNSRGAVFFVTALFLLGALFGYFIVAPLSINFLANYQVDASITNEFDITSYLSTLTTLVLACAIMFEMPVIVFFLTKAGLVSPEILKLYRRHAVVVILIIAALISPPDVLSMTLLGIPLLLLYEASILLSGMVKRSDLKKLNAQNKD